MLVIRSMLQRRRWRAPKSVVESLPVRVYTAPVPHFGQVPLDQEEEQGDGQQQPQEHDSNQRKRQKLRRNRERKNLCALLTGHSGSAGAVNDSCENRNSESNDGTTNGVDNRTPPQNVFRNIPSSSVECVVCLEDYVPHVSRVMRLPCGHEFHVDCITPWLVTKRRTCPICKGDVVKMVQEDGAVGGGVVSDADVERAGWVGYDSGDEIEDRERSSTADRSVETEEGVAPAHARGWVGDWWRWIIGVVGGRRERSPRGLVHRQRAGEAGRNATTQGGRLGRSRGRGRQVGRGGRQMARAMHETQTNGAVNERTPLMTSTRVGGNSANGIAIASDPRTRD